MKAIVDLWGSSCLFWGVGRRHIKTKVLIQRLSAVLELSSRVSEESSGSFFWTFDGRLAIFLESERAVSKRRF